MAPANCFSKTPARAAAGIALLILLAFTLSAGCLDAIQLPALHEGTDPPSPHTVDGKLRVYFLDVGQGDSTVILFGNRTVLIDAGDMDHGDTVTGSLAALGVDHIDLLVATHPHSDHIGGMEAVLLAYPVSSVLDAGIPHTSSLYEDFLDTIENRGIAYTVAQQGAVISLDGLRILVLSPPQNRTGDDLNDNSIILRISYGTTDFLFTGDAGQETESFLIRTGYALDAEVLKVAHHGSSDATSAAFLSRVNPKVAVISVGSGNEYGHPHHETIDALKDAGVTLYRTDMNGTVLVTSDGSSYSVRTTNTADKTLTLAPATPQTTRTKTATPSATATVTATVTATATARAAEPVFTLPGIPLGNGTSVKIAKTQFNAKGDDRLNLNGEWVVLENTGSAGVLLGGWSLEDESGERLYTFPLFILDPGKNVTLFTGHGDYNDTALFMGKDEPVWSNSGDTAILKDAVGREIDRASEA